MVHYIKLDALLEAVRDGDEHGWDVEFDQLWSEQGAYMDRLCNSIQAVGIRMPVLVGNDGRVWDGHHRLCAAKHIGLALVPVQFSGEDDDEWPLPPAPTLAAKTPMLTYVGWGGRTESIVAEINLGVAGRRPPRAPYGIRRAIFDAAFGYVNGFKLTGIAYYVLTRSLSQRVWHYTYFRENPDRDRRLGCGGKSDRRPGRPTTQWCSICYPKGGPRL